MAFGEINPRRHKFWLSVEFLKVYGKKNTEATILFVNFAKVFDTIHRIKMEETLLTNRQSHNDAILKHESKSLRSG